MGRADAREATASGSQAHQGREERVQARGGVGVRRPAAPVGTAEPRQQSFARPRPSSRRRARASAAATPTTTAAREETPGSAGWYGDAPRRVERAQMRRKMGYAGGGLGKDGAGMVAATRRTTPDFRHALARDAAGGSPPGLATFADDDDSRRRPSAFHGPTATNTPGADARTLAGLAPTTPPPTTEDAYYGTVLLCLHSSRAPAPRRPNPAVSRPVTSRSRVPDVNSRAVPARRSNEVLRRTVYAKREASVWPSGRQPLDARGSCR